MLRRNNQPTLINCTNEKKNRSFLFIHAPAGRSFEAVQCLGRFGYRLRFAGVLIFCDMKKLSVKEQLEILNEIKIFRNKCRRKGWGDSFFLCLDLKRVYRSKYGDIDKNQLVEVFPLFTRKNSEKFSTNHGYGVWFKNDIERHAFLDWMIEQLEAELKQENE